MCLNVHTCLCMFSRIHHLSSLLALHVYENVASLCICLCINVCVYMSAVHHKQTAPGHIPRIAENLTQKLHGDVRNHGLIMSHNQYFTSCEIRLFESMAITVSHVLPGFGGNDVSCAQLRPGTAARLCICMKAGPGFACTTAVIGQGNLSEGCSSSPRWSRWGKIYDILGATDRII